MTLTLKVPSIACDACATTIIKAIQSQQPDAQVVVDVASKLVTIETTAQASEIKAAITQAGHEVAP